MSAESEEDSELYHVDFTTASEWEVFIARVEELIQEWKLQTRPVFPPKLKLSTAQWHSKSEELSFADVDFTVTHHYATFPSFESRPSAEGKANLPQCLEDVMSSDNDFPPLEVTPGEGTTKPHVLARWYGLRDFVVLTPNKAPIVQESKLKILLSSLCVALTNTSCEVPMFVRALEFWQDYYMGICEGRGVRGEFEMVHLKKVPQQCRYLTGLLSVFKSKVTNSPVSEPVTVAAHFSYLLTNWTSFIWPSNSPDVETELPNLFQLPFGSMHEPIASLTLHAFWPEMPESVVADSEAYTDFEPLEAPVWAISINKVDSPACILTEYMMEFVIHCSSNVTTEELIEVTPRDTGAGDMIQPLNILTESRIPNLTSILLSSYTGRKRVSEGPIPSKTLIPLLHYLFPDTDTDSEHPYPKFDQPENPQQRVKTCPVDGLVWRLAIVAAHALNVLGSSKAVAHLWQEFCQEIRFRWNVAKLIPGVTPGFPDPKTCLLHQKLQMINCCIERRLKREEELASKSKEIVKTEDEDFSPATEVLEESDEEFFDCDEDNGEEGKERQSGEVQPQGRLAQHGSLKLLKSGQPLYIPITQGATPKTEDQLEEDVQVLIQLGSDTEGSQLRAKLMSASLLSDMESFKAANPGAVIEDFIRWYSPRDWIESEEEDEFGQKKGTLSARMQLPGNTWLEVWASAKGVPAKRQKRLFDETTEGEKALHMIESSRPGPAASLLLPVLAHAAVLRIEEEIRSIQLPSLHSGLNHLLKKLETVSRQSPADTRRFQELSLEIGQMETVLSQIRSLEFKLNCEEGEPMLAERLVSESEVVLPRGSVSPTAQRVKQMFLLAEKALIEGQTDSPAAIDLDPRLLKEATEREFILRLAAPRPSSLSRFCPQRLAARVSKSGLMMAGLFSQDTMFF